MHDDRDDRNRSCETRLAVTHQLTRRGFLYGAGALSLAGLIPSGWLLAEQADGATVPHGPRLGALFNPYHRPRDWVVLTQGRPEGMPQLGAYGSKSAGGVATQIIWARQMGLGFFLADYCLGRPGDGLDTAFEAAHRSDFAVGLLLDLEGVTREARSVDLRDRLEASLDEVTARYLSHPAYLRTEADLPVLAVAGLDDGTLLDETLERFGGRRDWGPVFRLPAAWRWRPDSNLDRALYRTISSRDIYPGYSLRQTGRAASRLLPNHGESTFGVLMAPARDEERGITLPPLPAVPETSRHGFVVLDSFNHWGISIPLEPGTRSRQRYADQVSSWSRTYEA